MRRRTAAIALAITAVATLAPVGTAAAQSFTVTTTTDSNDTSGCTASLCSLRDAVVAADAAGGSSTITVPAGRYTLTIPAASGDPNDATEGDLDITGGANVTITGAGAASTTIDANQIDRAFAVHAGSSLQISGVTIENGAQNGSGPSENSIAAGGGGAIYNDGSLSISDATLSGNQAAIGGAVVSNPEAVSTSISDSTVASNSAPTGGAIAAVSGTLTLSGDTFSHNSGVTGTVEAAGASVSAVTVTDDTFSEDAGGALDIVGTGPLTVTGSTFVGNPGEFGVGGGAIVTGGPTVSIAGSSFTDNGGAVILDGASASTPESISDSTFAGNSSGFAGGAVWDANGDLHVTQSTFVDNSATNPGVGGLYDQGSGGLELTNDTFDSNNGFAIALSPNTSGSTTELVNDTIVRNHGGGIAGPEEANGIENTIVADNGQANCLGSVSSDSAGAADVGGNIDSDGTCFSDSVTQDQTGVDPLLGPLADNGGPTETDALLPDSPAIGHAIGADCPAMDQRGVPRSATSCDVGAFQTAPANLSLKDLAPSSVVANEPFTYAITVSNGGPAPSTNTTVVDQLPAGTTLWGADPSQGSCSASGTPAKTTCNLGVIARGSSASITLVVSISQKGSVTDTATATNDQGSSASASAITKLIAPGVAVGSTKPTAITDGASGVSKHRVRLSGTITAGGQPTYWFFQYGKTKKLGRATFLVAASSAESVLRKLSRLLAGTKYHYRLVAINDSGTAYGAKRTFKTK